MGRFLQTDPIGSDDDINLYAYTSGDPIKGNHLKAVKIQEDHVVFQMMIKGQTK